MKKYKLIKEYPFCNYSNGDVITVDETEKTKIDIYSYYYEFWQEVKEPLFVTEDGFEVFNGMKIVYAVDTDYLIEEYHSKNIDSHIREYYRLFSTKLAASKWIKDNKPEFSRKHVLDAINKTLDNSVYGWTEAINIFKKELGL